MRHIIIKIVSVLFILVNLQLVVVNWYKGNYENFKPLHRNLARFQWKTVVFNQQELSEKIELDHLVKDKLSQISKSWLTKTDLAKIEVAVDFNQFVGDLGWLNKDEIYYDPRFTLTMYLNAIKTKYLDAGGSKMFGKIDSNEVLPISLPFHWVDWLDVTVLNDQLTKPMKERIDCKVLQKHTNHNPEPEYFCSNDQEVEGFTRSQLPGFIIHNHCHHGDRTSNNFRVLQAKSYVMTNMPNPKQVIILNNNGGTYEFDVGSKERLLKSKMIYDYIGRKPQLNYINHLNELKDLQSEVHPLRPSRETLSLLNPKMFNYEANVETKVEMDEEETIYFKSPVMETEDPRNVNKDWGWSYDWRFFNGAFHYERDGFTEFELEFRKKIILDRLIRNWSRFSESKGLINWISGDTLKSWRRNGIISNLNHLEVQMPISEILKLVQFNNTVVVEDPTQGYGRYYIDVNKFIHKRKGGKNFIDARFIDVESGAFIDITGLSGDDIIYNKHEEVFSIKDISPLKQSTLNGVLVNIPSYCSTQSYEHGKYYIDKLNLWISKDQLTKTLNEEEVHNVDNEYLSIKASNLTNSEILILLDDKVTLLEYYLTRDYTSNHEIELKYLFDELGENNVQIAQMDEFKRRYNEFVSTFRDGKVMTKCLYDFEHFTPPESHP
ncbi:hypothetical protein CLIB1444_19S01024 [[Candida] jaroonii]|uniref:Uncharacterized protein n=1 Tax=[Candida] jaroonii TaxID=467808 RepID=A0ACA9YFP4_9ASCO|nr:hypothetical protein CLIB1444_19S01024 [[Candida] jaroonii]